MDIIFILFWICIGIVVYSIIGYPVLLFVLVKVKRLFIPKKIYEINDYPEVSLLIAAYNEIDFIEEKIKNCRELNYPKDKIHFIWGTDGSNDGTPEKLKLFSEVTVLHNPERKGKIAAINRAMPFIKTPFVVFCDANTYLNPDAIINIILPFSNKKVGCVAGEKRIFSLKNDTAAGSGEGFYWKYESFLKKYDFELYSAVGAAGELFAIRTELFQEVEKDTLLDDFIISMRIALKGYIIAYTPNAYAVESSSANVKEELKRKIRISAGGIQSVFRLLSVLNPFGPAKWLSFQFFSHKILRWLIVPFLFPIVFVLNLILIIPIFKSLDVLTLIFLAQCFFYIMVLMGKMLKDKKISFKIIFIPYYVFVMNYSMYPGIVRYFKGKQSVNWERAKRA